VQREGISIQYRVQECLSLRLNWLPPPSPQASMCPPTWILGVQTLACGRGSGGSPLRRPARNSCTLYTLRCTPLFMNHGCRLAWYYMRTIQSEYTFLIKNTNYVPLAMVFAITYRIVSTLSLNVFTTACTPKNATCKE
jgi:hypothetical protein